MAAAALLFVAAGGVAAWWPMHRNSNRVEAIQAQIREAGTDEKNARS